MKDSTQSKIHFDFLDGIRGLMAFWVLFFHLNGQIENNNGINFLSNPLFHWLSYGKDPVTVFIFLSGFCLMLPMLRKPPTDFVRDFREFFRRRAIRILPAYYATLALSLITTYLSYLLKNKIGIIDNSNSWKENFDIWGIITHLFLIHNLFSQYSFIINPAAWSLGVEWQIYFIFYLILLPIWMKLKAIKNKYISLLLVVLLGFTIGFLPIALLPDNRDLSWCRPWYVGIFALGMACATIVTQVTKIHQIQKNILIGSGMCILILLEYFRQKIHFPSYIGDIAIGTVAFLLIYSEAKLPGIGSVVLNLKPIKFLGNISYSLYLIHGLVITRICTFFGSRHLDTLSFSLISGISGLFFSILVAWLSYRLFELPWLTRRKQQQTD